MGHIKIKTMVALEVTARQFRENQRHFFDLADKGRQLVIKRGKNKSYFLTPVQEDDFEVTPALLTKLDNIRQQMRNGEYTECRTLEELHAHLDSL